MRAGTVERTAEIVTLHELIRQGGETAPKSMGASRHETSGAAIVVNILLRVVTNETSHKGLQRGAVVLEIMRLIDQRLIGLGTNLHFLTKPLRPEASLNTAD